MCMGNANIKLEERHAFGELCGVCDPSVHDTKFKATSNSHLNKTLRAPMCFKLWNILAPLVFLVIINWPIKKCIRNNIITRNVHVFAISLALCRLIIERQHKILVTQSTSEASCWLLLHVWTLLSKTMGKKCFIWRRSFLLSV